MGNRNIKLGSTLTFDEVKEKDLIEKVEYLTQRHKLGQFLSNLIRLAFENPEVFKKASGVEIGSSPQTSMMDTMDRFGVSPTRMEYLKHISKEVETLKSKVNFIYDTCLELKTLTKFNKVSDRVVEAGVTEMTAELFQIEYMIAQLQSNFSVGGRFETFGSNRLLELEKRADDVLNYILTTHKDLIEPLMRREEKDGIVGNENDGMRSSEDTDAGGENVTIPSESLNTLISAINGLTEALNSRPQAVYTAVAPAQAAMVENKPASAVVEKTEPEVQSRENDEEVIDFGEDSSTLSGADKFGDNMDFEALSNMFGC